MNPAVKNLDPTAVYTVYYYPQPDRSNDYQTEEHIFAGNGATVKGFILSSDHVHRIEKW